MAILQSSFLENPMDRGAWRAVYNLWDCKELDMTERQTFSLHLPLMHAEVRHPGSFNL